MWFQISPISGSITVKRLSKTIKKKNPLQYNILAFRNIVSCGRPRVWSHRIVQEYKKIMLLNVLKGSKQRVLIITCCSGSEWES